MPDYDNQRPKVAPPLIPLAAHRASHGLSQTDVCKIVSALTNKSFTKGALSAIEGGHRGASAETLAALEVALRFPPGTLVVSYAPSHARRKSSEDEAA